MSFAFIPIQLEKQETYRSLLALCPQKASDYSFINVWGWSEAHGLEWAWEEDLVWIRQTTPETRYWAPVGDWERTDWEQVFERRFSDPVEFVRVPEALSRIWESTFHSRTRVEETRGDWDYVYAVEDLSTLRGNRFHKKKNLVNQFKKKYQSKYISLDTQTVWKAMDMQTDWCTWRDCESFETLAAENRSIEKILRSWDRIQAVLGGALQVEDEMVAYTVAEALSHDTILIHFEKANPDYKGAYQAINQRFLQEEGAGMSLVNREQDLGDEGLRKAKTSYHPVDYVRKNSVTVYPS